jgi:hypothetical protein
MATPGVPRPPFVPDDFAVPRELVTGGFRLEPLGPQHNAGDYEAWTSSMEHIRATPGFAGWGWPVPMTLDDNLRDLRRHAQDFAARSGFTYTVLAGDGDRVVGCVYIYPAEDGAPGAADVRSWVRADRAELDVPVHDAVSAWLAESWPFTAVRYAER